ncbi:LysM peptidoglycan-binding domain-containing protein [Nitratireductor sp. ZSWI3]|uniref:LysM peptidoglycan-binding domain-containing protein n=1 Tax=Nitratireductor sp. ZSWI3 TaxID=2966359 RepID=UPI002150070B|nr:LysM peptidoglycan-binding domain-containing protein [Nitratireductor sp. ZSWI3]MCR4264817.1 LysM peptidoglycan-binding domain-containing protein [Nitratireductor sp. ZSWI3]
MSYRIDPNATQRYNADGTRATSLPEQLSSQFREEIAAALREREEAGGEGTLDPIDERLAVVENGDSLTEIAAENQVSLEALLAANQGNVDGNGNLIHPGEIIFLPRASAELVAAGPVGPGDIPQGEAAFLSDLYDRGNELEYADDPSVIDYEAEGQAIQDDVGAYLDSLPADERQAAALRLVQADWVDAGPVGHRIEAAIAERGLHDTEEGAFASELYGLGNELEYADDPAAIDFDGAVTSMAGRIEAYLEGLPESERGSALQRLYDHDWRDAGPASMAIEQAARQAGIELRPSTHSGPDVDAAARSIVDEANAAGSPDEAFRLLNEGYASAAPQVQAALDQSADARSLVEQAAEWATEPLDGYDPSQDLQAPAAQTFARLEQLTDGAQQGLAVDLLEAAMPDIEAGNQVYQSEAGSSMLGPNGTADMLTIVDRIAGSPGSEAVISDFAAMDFYSRDAIMNAVSSGSGLDYPMALATEWGNGSGLFGAEIDPGVRQFHSQVGADVDAYSQHMQELQWLIQNHGGTMTPEQLAQAIEDYKAEKGAGWQETEQNLEREVAESGALLLEQLTQLSDLPPEMSGDQPAADALIAEILEDPKAVMAMQVAMQTDPELLANPSTLNFLGSKARLTDRGRKLAEEAMTQILRHQILPSFSELSTGDANSIAQARTALENFRNSRTAQLLGITDSDLSKAIDAVERSLPEVGDTPADAARKMARLNSELNDLQGSGGVKSFSNTTVPGQLLRTIGLAATGASLMNSTRIASEDPSLKNNLKIVIDASGIAQRSVEILSGMERINPQSQAAQHFGSSSRPAVKFLGVLGAGFDAWNAVDAFRAGDPLMGSLSAVAAGGGVMAALGTGTAFGPAGLIIVGLAVGAQMIVSDHRESTKFETDTAMRFLEHSGLSEAAADALTDQSGDGHSPVPLLMRYAELKGYDLEQAGDRQQFIDWLNAIPKEQLEALRDNLHHTADSFDGDASQLEQTASSDANYTDPERLNDTGTGRARYTSTASRIEAGNATPSSAAQIDVVLSELGISALA